MYLTLFLIGIFYGCDIIGRLLSIDAYLTFMAAPFPSLTAEHLKHLKSLIKLRFSVPLPTRPQVIEFEEHRFVLKFQRQEKNRSRQERLRALGYLLLFRK